MLDLERIISFSYLSPKFSTLMPKFARLIGCVWRSNAQRRRTSAASRRSHPLQPAQRLADCPEQQRWLVDRLWSEEAVGIIGGKPKCGKSLLALDLAVAVAAGMD
jgi:hypothetical protein